MNVQQNDLKGKENIGILAQQLDKNLTPFGSYA